jgi:hypothetical protein
LSDAPEAQQRVVAELRHEKIGIAKRLPIAETELRISQIEQ